MEAEWIVAIIIGVLIVGLIAVGISCSFSSVEDVTITIKEKERITDGDGSYYLIFTEGEVFKNEDSFMHGKFASSDLYNEMEVGKTYNVKVNWYRVPFWSMYRNILEIYSEVEDAN